MLTRNCLCTSCLCWWILNLQHPQQREYNCTLIMSCTLVSVSRTLLSRCTLALLHSALVYCFCTLVSVYSRAVLCTLDSVLSTLYYRLCTLAAAFSHCTLYSRLCTLDSLYPRLCLSHCTLDSVESLYPHLCTLSHSALILHSALACRFCALCASVLSRCTLNSVHLHCTRLCTLSLSSLYFQFLDSATRWW